MLSMIDSFNTNCIKVLFSYFFFSLKYNICCPLPKCFETFFENKMGTAFLKVSFIIYDVSTESSSIVTCYTYYYSTII